MTLTLHTVSGSPRGWRVLIGLVLKGLEWDTRLLQLSTMEHRSEAFRALNPRATVPVLEADGLVLRDSIAILAWLDRQYPEHPLFGRSPEQAAHIWQLTMECCDYLRDAGNELLAPILLGGKPLPDEGTGERDAFDAAAQALHAEYRWLENRLDGCAFVAGDTPSAADAVAFPEIRLVRRAVETKPEIMAPLGFEEPPARYPGVVSWMDRVAALPGMAATMPPHWQS